MASLTELDARAGRRHRRRAAVLIRPARGGEPRAGRQMNDQVTGGGMALRLAGQARGFSQQQLAGMAGVSRQAVSAVESGLSDPSLRVALALARALGVTVEELFGPGGPVSPVAARPVAPLGGQDARVALAPMGEEFVALPLSGDPVGRARFLPADGLAE